MFMGIAWYWWIATAAAVGILVLLKIRFMKWWSRRQQEKNERQRGKWGDEE